VLLDDELIFFQPKRKFGSTAQLLVNGVWRNGESAEDSQRLFIVVVFGDVVDALSDDTTFIGLELCKLVLQ